MSMSLKRLDTCGVNHLFNQKYRFLLLPTNPDLEGLKDDDWGLFAIAELVQMLKQSGKIMSIDRQPLPTFIMRWINKDLEIKHTKTVYLYSVQMVSLVLDVSQQQVRKYLEGNYIKNPLSVASRPYSIHLIAPQISILQTRLSLLELTIIATRLSYIPIKPKKETQDYVRDRKYQSWQRPTGLRHTHRFL
jgi:hypothetical protein